MRKTPMDADPAVPSAFGRGAATPTRRSAAFGRREARIAERARELWLLEGCPVGREREHWARAEEVVRLLDSVDS